MASSRATVLTIQPGVYVSVLMGFFKLGLVEGWAFRSFSVNMLFSYPIIIFANYYLFGALYGRGAVTVAGFTRYELMAYISVAWLMRSVFPSRSGRFLAQRIRSGALATDLMKPLPLFGSALARNLGFSVVTLISVFLPLSLILLAGRRISVALATTSWLFLLSAFLGYLILYACNYILGILGFYLEYTNNLLWLFDLLLQLLGGLTVPLAFFPEGFRNILNVLPFRDIYTTPTQIYLGQIPAAMALGALGRQLLWLIVLFFIGSIFFRMGLRKLTINGG